MTLRIETAVDGRAAVLRLIGRIDSEYLPALQAQVQRHRPRLMLDLDEVTLVDVGVVQFLSECEAEGIELLNCAPYIREWMGRERLRVLAEEKR
jgi:anti-anti-sigma regulatory factor